MKPRSRFNSRGRYNVNDMLCFLTFAPHPSHISIFFLSGSGLILLSFLQGCAKITSKEYSVPPIKKKTLVLYLKFYYIGISALL